MTLGLPSPTAFAESQWGEPCSDASGRAGHVHCWVTISVAGPAAPSGQLLVLAICRLWRLTLSESLDILSNLGDEHKGRGWRG